MVYWFGLEPVINHEIKLVFSNYVKITVHGVVSAYISVNCNFKKLRCNSMVLFNATTGSLDENEVNKVENTGCNSKFIKTLKNRVAVNQFS